MSAATKQNGKLIDSCRGPEEKAGGGVCVYVRLCMYLCLSACVSMSYEEQQLKRPKGRSAFSPSVLPRQALDTPVAPAL